MAHFGQQVLPVPMPDRIGGVDTLLIHPHPPTHLSLLLCHHHPHKDYFKGVGPTRGKGKASGPAPGHMPRVPRSFGFHPPRLCSGRARRGSGRGQSGSALPFPVHPNGKCRDTFPPSPLLRMWIGSGWGPPSHLVCGRPGKGEYGGPRHPESGHDEGPAIL